MTACGSCIRQSRPAHKGFATPSDFKSENRDSDYSVVAASFALVVKSIGIHLDLELIRMTVILLRVTLDYEYLFVLIESSLRT